MTIEVEALVSVESASAYQPLSDADIKQLAFATLNGDVFGSWMLDQSSRHLMNMIFMPLCLMNEVQLKIMERDGIVHAYGHMSKAAPRGINGFPIFYELSTLDRNDFHRMREAVKKLVDLHREFLEEGT
jgi:hypothetical protein